MYKYEDDCVGCEVCVNCGRKHVMHTYCDNCEEETSELYEFADMALCLDCLLEMIPKVEYKNSDADCDADEYYWKEQNDGI